jgi:hypothetical protein
MATQENTRLEGSIGNIIFYKFRGGYYMRSKPVNVTRNDASVKSAQNFGKASRICRQIREMIEPINPAASDKRAIYRFTGALNKMINWKEKNKLGITRLLGILPLITGFQFNDQADIPLAIKPVVTFPASGRMEIQLMPFVSADGLYAPYNTEHIIFKIVITTTNMSELKTTRTDIPEIKIPYNHETFSPESISLPVITDQDSLILIVLTIEYFVNTKEGTGILNSVKNMPCGIIWSDWM